MTTISIDKSQVETDNLIRFETVILPFLSARLNELFRARFKATFRRDWQGTAGDVNDYR